MSKYTIESIKADPTVREAYDAATTSIPGPHPEGSLRAKTVHLQHAMRQILSKIKVLIDLGAHDVEVELQIDNLRKAIALFETAIRALLIEGDLDDFIEDYPDQDPEALEVQSAKLVGKIRIR